MVDTTCGTCKYHVKRPSEVMFACVRDGVCLRVGRAVSAEWRGSISPCNCGIALDRPDMPTHRKGRERG